MERPPSLVERAESSTTSSSATATTSCGKNDNSGACEKYYGSSGSDTTLPIVLGVVIPLGIALIILVYLHRRHVKKLRREDAEDRHKSLDFGLDESKKPAGKQHSRKYPEMSMAGEKEMGSGRSRGLSLDMGTQNPFLLPPGLQNSRESLHSLSRLNTGEDRYRPTDFIPDDGSIRPPSSMRSPHDDSSSYTGSSSRRFQLPSGRNTPGDSAYGVRKSGNNLLAPARPDQTRNSTLSTTSSIGAMNALRASNNYLGQFISGGAPLTKHDLDKKEPVAAVTEVKVDTPITHVQPPPPVLIKDSPPAPLPSSTTPKTQDQNSSAPSITLNLPEDRQTRLSQFNFTDAQANQQQNIYPEQPHQREPVTANTTAQHSHARSTDLSHHQSIQSVPSFQDQPLVQHDDEDYYDEYEVYGDAEPQYYDDQDFQDYYDHQEQMGHDPRRSMMGRRPLPPDDPSENPEDRANRIRSFYKEYFEEGRTPNQTQQHAQYYNGAEGYFDQRGNSQHHGGYYDQQGFQPPRGMSQAGSYGRHRATISNGSYQSGPRAFSSASARGAGPRMLPQKRLPPPKALSVLPTPSKLKEDTFIPIDFAPPKKFHNQRSGTPDSLRGGMRPYSPTVKAHIPLASSFDDLAMIPSP